MKRLISGLVLSAVLLAGVVPLRASSFPVVQGNASGIELCEQAVCGAAIFVAIYSGQIGNNLHSLGTMAVAVTHTTPLPEVGEPGFLTGGYWQLQPLFRPAIKGWVTGGTLSNNGDNTYHVVANLHIVSGGIGELTFDGTLSHNAFPPTIIGTISQ
jgi:hypothetical protein